MKSRGGAGPESGKTIRWVKWLVVVLWLVAMVALAPLGAKLQGAEKNNASSFLPRSAQSTQVLKLQERFASGNVTPAVIVFRREGGLSQADLAEVGSDRKKIENLNLKGVLGPGPLVPSRDGAAALFAVPIEDGSGSVVVPGAVEKIRSAIGEGSGGLDIKVTGPAGFATDIDSVYGSVDLTLLLATVIAVTVLLLLIYRSPFLWLLPLITLALAVIAARAAAYGLTQAGFIVNAQSSGIQTILVFGVGTDYALLLVARYREELRRHTDHHAAMMKALRRAVPAIVASAATVTISLLCLLASELNSNRGLGPAGAVGVLSALVAALTVLPALLLVFGRGVFWPYIPRFGTRDPKEEGSGLFARLGRRVAVSPRRVWVGTVVMLVILALGLSGISTDLTTTNGFRNSVDSVQGQKLIAKSYPAGSSSPTTVIVKSPSKVQKARSVAAASPDVSRVGRIETSGNLTRFDITLASAPEGEKTFDAISTLRDRLRGAVGGSALVGGQSAQELDVHQAANRDSVVVTPLVLLVVLVILGLLLRSVVAPLVLTATVILSFAASLGASVWVFDHLFGFPGIDPSLPLHAFVFLVALGVDYNIFLVARAREESVEAGTRVGMLKALAVTGGVITSAGVVLAATFAVAGVLPLIAFKEIGFAVAFGVLMDTMSRALRLSTGTRLADWGEVLVAGPLPSPAPDYRKGAS